MDIPPEFEAELTLAQQLEVQKQRDPRSIGPLIQVYERVIEQLQPDVHPNFYAAIQHSLGAAYWGLPTGDRAANLERAIACYQEALRFRTPETSPLDYATTQTNLGAAYRNLPTGDHAANLERAIACYQEALRFRTPETSPLDYATTQNNLGVAYRNLPTGDRAANLERAIACYQEALRFWTPETAPPDYAMTQNNLGLAYSELPTGDRAANLERAIACYQEALRFWTPETAPFSYATIQSNLGTAYWELLTGDRAANLERAIACYQEALRFRTPETAPPDYAMTQNNLGVAYSELPTRDRAVNLERAIACYQEALRFWTPETAPPDYAMTQNNLGVAYRNLPTGDRAANLERAIAHHQEALRFRTPETTPLDYATTQNNLGLAYSELPTGDRAANLERAIACYQEALRFRTPESAPFSYATTRNNLGAAYWELPTGDRAANLERAIVCYQEALRFWTPETAPDECRMTNRNLADLYFSEGEWKFALDAYRAAMEAGEQLYRAGLSTESKAIEVAKNTILYRHAAFSAVRCGQITEALLSLERGKTRLLVEALRLRIRRPAHVPDETWNAFEQAAAAVREVQSRWTTRSREERDPVSAYMARVQDAQVASTNLKAAIEHVQDHAPDFLQESDLSAIHALLPDEQTVLVVFCITEKGSMGFVVDHNHDHDIQVVEVPSFTQTDLHRLFTEWDADGRAVSGWLGAYRRYLKEPTQTALATWQSMMTNTFAELGRCLLAPILSILPSDVERIILLPSAELFLLPLYAVPLSNTGLEQVCDRYQISYAPSIEVLTTIRAKVMQQVTPGTPNLYAVINPQADSRLVFTFIEGAAIAQLFALHTVDEGRVGTKQRVLAALRGRTYVHFACHGSYDWNEPPESGLDLTDGRLTLAELQRGEIDLSFVRLIMLSACETGLVDVTKGSAEEYVGVPAGFLLAGVPCVVASLWEVPDFSTALLMERFYHNHLKGRMDFAAALREAQVWIRELEVGEVVAYAEQCYQLSQRKEKPKLFRIMRYYRYQAEHNPTSRPFEHPYYWAAFTVNGI